MREEILEILTLIEHSGRPFSEIRVDAPRSVLERTPLPERVGRARVTAVPYDHGVGINAFSKVRGLLSFAGRVLRRRPVLVFSGFSMLKHRVVSGALRVPHFAYIRGVVFDPRVSVGISDRVRFGVLKRLVPRRVVATYSADQVFTVGEVNRRFLLGRGIPADRVHVVGPVWLAPELRGAVAAQQPYSPRAYFVTGAWEAHGRMEEHEAQLEITRRLAREWRNGTELAFRVHPRDLHQYEADPDFANVVLDRTPPEEFLESLSEQDVVIAPLSTLAFEALFVGRRVVFYRDPSATSAYNHIYDKLGIRARTIDEILDGRIDESTIPEVSVFADFRLDGMRGVRP